MGHWIEKKVDDLPATSVEALRTAITLEMEPESWFDDLAWIMAQESGGKVNVPNHSGSSARGLFQLTKALYGMNPHGAQSFGNPVDECRGGIRYIKQRYHTPAQARVFWVSHHWY